MATSITFENATLADAIKRASRIAPTKAGSAFDKAAGLVFEISPGTDYPCVLRATNTDLFFIEWVDATEATGDQARWRLPSAILAQAVSRLPIGSGKTCTFTTGAEVEQKIKVNDEVVKSVTVRQVIVKSGRFKMTVGLIADYEYPNWEPVDPAFLSPVSGLGARLQQVSWAVDPKVSPYSGVHMDGKYLIATDKYRLAVVDCEIPQLLTPVTVPVSNVAPLLREMGDTSLGVVDNQLVFVPTGSSQLKSRIFEDKYPPVHKIMATEFEHTVIVDKSELVEMVQRVIGVAGTDRMPKLTMFLGGGELAVFIADPHGTDDAEDAVSLAGQADHTVIEMGISPDSLVQALTNAPNEKVAFSYKSPRNNLVMVDGGSGYRAWLQLRRDAGTATP